MSHGRKTAGSRIISTSRETSTETYWPEITLNPKSSDVGSFRGVGSFSLKPQKSSEEVLNWEDVKWDSVAECLGKSEAKGLESLEAKVSVLLPDNSGQLKEESRDIRVEWKALRSANELAQIVRRFRSVNSAAQSGTKVWQEMQEIQDIMDHIKHLDQTLKENVDGSIPASAQLDSFWVKEQKKKFETKLHDTQVTRPPLPASLVSDCVP